MRRGFTFHSNAVWPPLGWVVLVVVAYGLLDAGLWLIERATPNWRGEFSEMPEVMKWRSAILGAAAAFYALYRLWRFHPRLNPGYAAWLTSSPWTTDKRLPLGPVHPVWQDAVVVGVLGAFAQWHAKADPAIPIIAFGLTYLVAMTFLLASTRTWAPVLALFFLWPAPMLPAMRGLPTTAIVVAMIGVTWYGHRKSLRAFPWRRNGIDGPEAIHFQGNKSFLEREIRIDGFGNNQGVGTTNMGWPFQWLSPRVEAKSIASSTAFAVSVLIGWWTFCVMVATEEPLNPGILLFFSVVAALLRLSMYCSSVGPPFNLWGRIASGRIIVPGFDRVLLTPVMVVALAIVGGIAIRHSSSWQFGVCACVVAMICFVLLSGGPKMRAWLLTGQHRCNPPRRLGTNKELLKPI